MKQTIIIFALMMLAALGACNDEHFYDNNSRHVRICGYLPDMATTRATMSPKESSLDMLMQWDENDFFSIFVQQDEQFYEVRTDDMFGYIIPITSISENRKSCTFAFDLPKEVDPSKPYIIFGCCGIERGAVDANGYVTFGDIVGAQIPDKLSVPMYFIAEKGNDLSKVEFKHFTTYEILHVTNSSKETIKFRFKGNAFDVEERWFYLQYWIDLPTMKINANDNFIGNFHSIPEDFEIKPGESKLFISNYVPTGKKIKNARLNAVINSQKVSSANTLSSDVELEIGKAYHMYATWDGNELKFGKEDRPCETDDYILSGDRKTLIKWKGSEEFVNMNSTPDLASIEIIGKEAFRELNTLKSIILPQGVKIIERDAFYLCKNVESISLPSSLLSIGIEAFGDCWKLKDITIPSSVEEIGKFAFYGCEELTSLVIPNKVKVIGEWTFWGCSNLKSITLSENLETIDEGAFLFCGSLESIDIPNSVRTIGVNAFSHCEKLSSIKLSNTLTMIGRRAFRECDIDKITIPQSVKDIDGEAFSECSRLYSIDVEPGNNYYCSVDGVLYNKDKTALLICGNARIGDYTIPGTVNTIGDGAFYGCSSLTTITIPNSVKTIGINAFRECSGLSSIVIPNSVTKLYSYAFYGCKKLTCVKLPESIETIPSWLCAWSPLKELEIPVNVKSIDRQAFEGCNLDIVKAYPILPPKMGWGVFSRGLQDGTTLFVNDESLDAYKNAEGWNDFGTILPLGGGMPNENGTPIGDGVPEAVD